MSDNINDVTLLKNKLVSYLVNQLEKAEGSEELADRTVLSTAAKMVKDFQFEIDEGNDAEALVRDAKLTKFFNKSKPASGKSVN